MPGFTHDDNVRMLGCTVNDKWLMTGHDKLSMRFLCSLTRFNLYLPDPLHCKVIWTALSECHIIHIECTIVNSLVLWQSFVVSGFGVNEHLDLSRGSQVFGLTVASTNVALQFLALTSSQFAKVRCTYAVTNAYTPEPHYINLCNDDDTVWRWLALLWVHPH